MRGQGEAKGALVFAMIRPRRAGQSVAARKIIATTPEVARIVNPTRKSTKLPRRVCRRCRARLPTFPDCQLGHAVLILPLRLADYKGHVSRFCQ